MKQLSCACGADPSSLRDWSFYELHGSYTGEKVPHYYCASCGMHHFRGKYYSRTEWFKWIN